MSTDLFSVAGETAVVTGAGRGIGEGIAKVLAAAGAKVVLGARRTDKLQAVCDAIVAEGACDFRHRAGVVERPSFEEVAFLSDRGWWWFCCDGFGVNGKFVALPEFVLGIGELLADAVGASDEEES